MNREIYQIGDLCFQLDYDPAIQIPPHFQLFRVAQGQPVYFYCLSCVDQLPVRNDPIIARRKDLCVMQSEVGEKRYIGVQNIEGYYALYEEESTQQAHVYLLRQALTSLVFDTFFTSLFALERRMMERQALILHCSYLLYRGQAILFSGPSGIGKSTQANLWVKHRHAKIINGDRALLRQKAGQWYACGWPVCGSSEICHLGDAPIQAIVFLSWSDQDHLEQLSLLKRFSNLYAQMTLNGWNRTAVSKGTALMDELIQHVPIYHLQATMEESAVTCLEGALEKQ